MTKQYMTTLTAYDIFMRLKRKRNNYTREKCALISDALQTKGVSISKDSFEENRVGILCVFDADGSCDVIGFSVRGEEYHITKKEDGSV